VAATVMLPSGDVKKYRSLRTLDAPHPYKRNGRWCVTAGTTRWTMWSSDKAEVLAAVLGAPGEAQVVESCPVPAQPPS
ncbi:MAG TPA: hypothetical protein VFJ74_08710, partial [Gemmatimonadaceae bacterium]|nr:hypothetical protein [Gemmatimonadaceae bacterium]